MGMEGGDGKPNGENSPVVLCRTVRASTGQGTRVRPGGRETFTLLGWGDYVYGEKTISVFNRNEKKPSKSFVINFR